MTAISERKRAGFNIYRAKKIAKRFYTQKARHFAKIYTIYVTFLYTKSMTLYSSRFFMKKLRLAFIYKQHETLRSVTFLYTKRQTLRKKQDNLRYFLYTKTRTLCVTQFFNEVLKLAEGGRHFYLHKIMHFALYFNMQKNNALCVMFLYLKFIVQYWYLTINSRTIREIKSKK